MFRENPKHLQFGLSDTVEQLPANVRYRPSASWADTFCREVFRSIDESPFTVLFADEPSRPNSPINILVGAETLKSAHSWSDEELHDQIQFNLQVRCALGLRDMGLCPLSCRHCITTASASVGT